MINLVLALALGQESTPMDHFKTSCESNHKWIIRNTYSKKGRVQKGRFM